MLINNTPTPYEPLTLLDYLCQHGYNPQRVVIERGGEILTRERFGEVALGEDDEINILQFMGGG